MALLITHQDDTALTAIALTAQRGVPSAVVDLKIKNTGIADVIGGFLTLYAENPPGSGTFVSSGEPVVDEIMGRFQITGQDSSETPGQEIVLGVVQPMGHLAIALLPILKPGDWILANFWIEQAGASAGGGSTNIKIEVANQRLAYPLPIGVSSVGTGIDTGRKQPDSFLIIGRATTVSGPPDPLIHVAPGSWLLEGEEYADATTQDLTLDQNDGASVALAATESYIAVITQPIGATPTISKGLKGVTPDRPTPPAGELILCWVTVAYTGGASVINTGDVEEALTYGRYRCGAPPTGLSIMVEAGKAIIADFAQVRPDRGLILLTASSTNRVWLEWNGAITVTLTDVPPSAGSIMLCQAVTDGSNITSVTDTRRYIHSGRLVHETPVGVVDGANADFTINEDDEGMLVLDGVVLVEITAFTRLGRTITYVTPPTGGQIHQWFHVG